ncbi:Aste57867_16965 [Aphanomyces stellatus]|uniref:Aste57867_16965 protein n=1 Tax=Aphanomyces stellatus TaxID=120398 RepID=A0A485L7U5_9STRA|nr:hypothetical protein As57867_016907 [Aphanomyces stellatus]VFT93727.1 Aste57867_16965 [Aphanomyces stellatus]
MTTRWATRRWSKHVMAFLILVVPLAAADAPTSPVAPPSMDSPNDALVQNCTRMKARLDNTTCRDRDMLRLGTNGITNATLERFCADTSCTKKLRLYSHLKDNCTGFDLPFVDVPLMGNPCKARCPAAAIYAAWYDCAQYGHGGDRLAACAACAKTKALLDSSLNQKMCRMDVDDVLRIVDVVESATDRNNTSNRAAVATFIRLCSDLVSLEAIDDATVVIPRRHPSTLVPRVGVADGGGASATTVALIVMVSIALLMVATWFVRRTQASPREVPYVDDATTDERCQPLVSPPPPLRVAAEPGHASEARSWCSDDAMALLMRLRLDDVVRGRLLAHGAHGQVFFGTCRGQSVAIKTLLPGRMTSHDICALVDEITLLSSLSHRYIVACVGVCVGDPLAADSLALVVEFMDQGDLRDYLVATPPSLFPWPSKLAVAWSVTKALVYLHARGIIHRDLKSRNVLLDAHKGTKLADFGASRLTADTMTLGVGTYRWMAPEVLCASDYTVAADIYSLGIVLSELDTHRIPYTNMKAKNGLPLVDTAVVGMVIAGAIHPTLSPACPPWMCDLIGACTALDPTLRPTAAQVSQHLRHHIVAEMESQRQQIKQPSEMVS